MCNTFCILDAPTKCERNDDDADDDEMSCIRMSQTTIILVQTNSGDSIKPFCALFSFFFVPPIVHS